MRNDAARAAFAREKAKAIAAQLAEKDVTLLAHARTMKALAKLYRAINSAEVGGLAWTATLEEAESILRAAGAIP